MRPGSAAAGSSDHAENSTAELLAALRRMGLAGPQERPVAVPLSGGVSSEIWRVDLRGGPVCVKRALAQLRVAEDWRVPVERWRYEVAWFRTAGAILPEAVPQLRGVDEAGGFFAMDYLDPAVHRLWKSELRDGRAEPAVAALVGARLVAIHAATANQAAIAAAFPSDAIFRAIRLEPYLGATAQRHPDRAAALERLIETTAATRRVLVHGDVSPKNILVGPRGPVFLDAECACYGDPAFDLAFCATHLLLKCLWRPATAPQFLGCFTALHEAYRRGIAWEPAAALEARAAALLPGLLLARIDGKSPVEYLTEAREKDTVRRVARELLAAPPSRLDEIAHRWAQEIGLG